MVRPLAVRHAVAIWLIVAAAGVSRADLEATHARNRQPRAPIRLVLVGDSTVTEESGWGRGFRHFVTDGAEVINLAASGRSSKSYLDEGRWADALARKGDFYLIQFGHNDEPGKGPERETDPETTFRANMTRYVDEARAIGARPVLVTSLVRRIYTEDGRIRTTQTPYVQAVRRLAADKSVPLVDLHAISTADAEHAGEEVWADLSPRDEQGQVDRTHLNAKGSDVVAGFVIQELRTLVPVLAPHFREQPLGR
jgi:pectinesterase